MVMVVIHFGDMERNRINKRKNGSYIICKKSLVGNPSITYSVGRVSCLVCESILQERGYYD